METMEHFLGKWTLIPEKTKYELGNPPVYGTYEIIENGDKLTFKMEWVDSEENTQYMEYSEICDSKYHEYENKQIADEICLSLTNERLLESFAKKDGKLVMSAKRELVSANELQVTMSGSLPDGSTYSNKSVYKKI